MSSHAPSPPAREVGGSAPWAAPAAEVVDTLGTSLEAGLSGPEAARRLELHGPNRLRCATRRSAWSILVSQLRGPLVGLLAVAAAVAMALGDQVEAIAIAVVVLVNTAIGFVTEQRAVRSMDALRRLGQTRTLVRRDGQQALLAAEELVPGDVIVLGAGDVLTADLRVVTGSRLQADEAPLTGESLPVDKAPDSVPADTPLPDRSCMLHRGTALTRGAGLGVVLATGMATELGRISTLVEGAASEASPLELRLERLARHLIGLTVVVATLVGAAILASGRGAYLAVETGIALAVATIPEGLPIVATLALARGMWRMARQNALIGNLAAVETLGATTLILTDKTGTLTEGSMTAVELRLPGARVELAGTGLETSGALVVDGTEVDVGAVPGLLEALRAGVLCSTASLRLDPDAGAQATGDPTEVALLVAGAKAGLERAPLLVELPELRQEAFDPDRLRMASVHRDGDGLLVVAKGAPEAIVACCTRVGVAGGPLGEEERDAWLAAAEQLARRGQRILGLAQRSGAGNVDGDAYRDLTLLGLVALQDPPRATVRAAVEACQAAGIRLVMVTGDHGATGLAIAEAVGLVAPDPDGGNAFVDGRTLESIAELDEPAREGLAAAPVIARATPEQKLDLIAMHQRRGEAVAMTGDGVNDAPALKQADIGIAMGQRGTQVACEAADVVLRDDELGTIVQAVGQGRAIFANIRRFVVYLLSCNVSEILVVGVGVLLQGPLPLLPLQILFLNLVTDVFPALALGGCEGSPGLMERRPRDPAEPILTRGHWRGIFTMGIVIAACSLGTLTLVGRVLGAPDGEASTAAFLTLALAQLWLVFGMRTRGTHWARNEVTRNSWVWAALALCVALLLAALYVPVLALALSLHPPSGAVWTLALGLSLVPAAVALAFPGAGRRR